MCKTQKILDIIAWYDGGICYILKVLNFILLSKLCLINITVVIKMAFQRVLMKEMVFQRQLVSVLGTIQIFYIITSALQRYPERQCCTILVTFVLCEACILQCSLTHRSLKTLHNRNNVPQDKSQIGREDTDLSTRKEE